jgi:uncharacterized protein (TIGR02147 family)
MTDAPDLYAYTDHRTYLADWFAWKKQANPRYSHGLFQRRAGVSSRGLFANVIAGRRLLTGTNVEAFATALELDDEGRAFFTAIVDLTQAADDAARNEAWGRVWSAHQFRDRFRIEGETFRYLSRWYVPATRELAATVGFRSEARWIAAHLRPRITETEAQQAIDTLVSLGLLTWKDGHLVQADARVQTAQQVQDLAVANYHRAMSQRAHDAVTTAAADERHLLGVTTAVPRALLPEIKAELNAFQRRLMDLCDAAEAEADGVLQINLQVFPLSEQVASRDEE